MRAVINDALQFEYKNYIGDLPELEKRMIECVKVLLSNGIDINSNEGDALYWAVYNGLISTTEFLVKNGASVASCICGSLIFANGEKTEYTLLNKLQHWQGRYNDEKFTNYFTDSTYGVFDFIFNLKSELYAARLAGYSSDVIVNEELLKKSGLTIKTAVPNFYYPDPDIAYHYYDKYE